MTHGSPVLAVAALEPGGRTAVGRFDGVIGVHGGFGDEQHLAGRAAARASHQSHHTTSHLRVNLTSSGYGRSVRRGSDRSDGSGRGRHDGAVAALAWLAGRQWLASGGVDAAVVVWDLRAGQARRLPFSKFEFSAAVERTGRLEVSTRRARPLPRALSR